MSRIPIFDSLVHPTLDGDWILPRYPQKSKIEKLLIEMESNDICQGFAVGLNAIGSYEESKYSEYVLSKTDKLLPIAYFDLFEHSDIVSVISKLKYLKSLNYRGIKLHPRIGKFNLLNPMLPEIIKAANDYQLVVLLCTYFYENSENAPYNTIENLLKLLLNIPDEKIMLMHSGSIRLMEMMEIARSFNKVLMDLSFTITKYQNSSLDIDIQYLFNSFDQRICIGSDFPEISISEMRARFDFFSKNIPEEKASNIAFKNICNFINF